MSWEEGFSLYVTIFMPPGQRSFAKTVLCGALHAE